MFGRAFISILLAFYCGVVVAESGQRASADGGVAINANNGAQVYVDTSRKIYNFNNKEDQRRILKLETERTGLLAELSRLSLGNEDRIIQRSRKDLIDSLPKDLQLKYIEGDWRAVVEHLENSKKDLKIRADKLNQALSKIEFEIAYAVSDSDPVKALEHLNVALELDSLNLPATALSIQLLTSMGRTEEVILLAENLRDQNWIAVVSKESAEEISFLVAGSFINAIDALLKSGRQDLAVEMIYRGLDFSASGKNRGYLEYSSLQQILKFLLELIERSGGAQAIDDYSALKNTLAGVDLTFADCENCWQFISFVAAYNLALAPMANLFGELDTAKIAFERAQKILAMKGLPKRNWFALRYMQLVSLGRSSAINGFHTDRTEYILKAIAHLKSGLASGVFTQERYIDIARLELEAFIHPNATQKTSETKLKFVKVSLAISDAIERTRGYELDHVDLLVSVSREYSEAGYAEESEVYFRKAEEILSKLSSRSDSAMYLKVFGRFLSARGYHQLRLGDFTKVNETADKWNMNVKTQLAKGVHADASEPIELRARTLLFLKGCEKAEPVILDALNIVSSQLDSNNTKHPIPFLRKYRLLQLLVVCSKYDQVAWERYLELFAYSDVLFQERPWDPENVDGIIFSLHRLFISDLAVRKGGGFLYYSELLRSRMMRCAQYRATVEKCSSYSAFALAQLGNSKIKTDPLLVDASLKEFQVIEKNGWLDQTAKELYMSTLTLYAGALNWEEDKQKYLGLQKEVLRVYDLVPEKERTERMMRWAESLRQWLSSAPSSKFIEKSWWFFGEVTFNK